MHVPEFHHPRDNILAFKFDETDFNHPYLRTVIPSFPNIVLLYGVNVHFELLKTIMF